MTSPHRHLGAAALAAAFSLLSPSAQAQAIDAAAAKALAKKNDCGKCHALDKTKKGPSYKKIAEKHRGKPDIESKLIKHLQSAPMVKLEDGTEEEHREIEAKNPAEIRNLIQWILAQ